MHQTPDRVSGYNPHIHLPIQDTTIISSNPPNKNSTSPQFQIYLISTSTTQPLTYPPTRPKMPSGSSLPIPTYPPPESESDETWVWTQIKAEAIRDAESEPALASYLYATVLSHPSLARSLSFHLANKLCSSTLLSTLLYDLFLNIFSHHPTVLSAAVADLIAVRHRDPACVSFSHCLLNFKGFLAVQVSFFG